MWQKKGGEKERYSDKEGEKEREKKEREKKKNRYVMNILNLLRQVKQNGLLNLFQSELVTHNRGSKITYRDKL